MRFTIYQESRTGTRRTNQDRLAYSYSRDALLMVIADGMGGHLHGEVAAQIAVQYITEAFQREANPKLADPLLFLSRSLNNAHHAILDYAGDRLLREAPRTTCVACVIQDSVAWWGHVGDSRLYLIRNGKVDMQTRDHSRVQMLVDQGVLTAEEAALHPARNRIYTCLGGPQPPQLEYSKRTPLASGDVLMLATDGAWGPLKPDTIAKALSAGSVMNAIPPLLDQAERAAGANCDNLSMIAVTWEEDYADGGDEGSVSTRTMPMHGFTTNMGNFSLSQGTPPPGSDLTEEEIERAIAEIRAAIHKYSK